MNYALWNTGGFAVERQCDLELRERNGQLFPGDVFTTGRGFLPASTKQLIHVVVPIWVEGEGNCVELLKSIVCQCMEKADTPELGSLAFPPLGLGYWAFPYQVAMDAVVETICEYLKSGKHTCLNTLNLCSINPVDYKHLVDRLKALISTGEEGFLSYFYSPHHKMVIGM